MRHYPVKMLVALKILESKILDMQEAISSSVK
jgi:hypothetical protein